jgi:branched-subunit amino acid aminotransferase/4-amino-4-deoxychorismate lyase
MRRFVIEELKKHGFIIQQIAMPVGLLQNANEIFLTNSIRGLKWVQSFKEKKFTCIETRKIYNLLARTIEG